MLTHSFIVFLVFMLSLLTERFSVSCLKGNPFKVKVSCSLLAPFMNIFSLPVELRSIMGYYLHFKAGVEFSSSDRITQYKVTDNRKSQSLYKIHMNMQQNTHRPCVDTS